MLLYVMIAGISHNTPKLRALCPDMNYTMQLLPASESNGKFSALHDEATVKQPASYSAVTSVPTRLLSSDVDICE
jgi:hypothetical protein